MSDAHFDDGASHRAKVVQDAENSLTAAVERMRAHYRLNRDAAELVGEIKKAMHVTLPPHGQTVLQTLCERERQKVIGRDAADEFPHIYEEFENAMRDFVIAGEGQTSVRKSKRIARNAWKQDSAVDRRVREMEGLQADKWRSPYLARPDIYDPGVVQFFVETITRVAGRKKFPRGNRAGGLMLAVLVCAIQWAMSCAWQGSAPVGTEPPTVTREGVLRIVRHRKSTRPTKSPRSRAA